jgi:chromosome partitioning protein
VGKTTTAVNLAASLALAGKRVLLIDCDPQGNAASGVGLRDPEIPTIYEALIGKVSLAETIQPTPIEGLEAIASGQELIGAEVELVDEEDRGTKLRDLLGSIRDARDYVILDCPPSLGMMTINALTAADSVLIPLQCEYYGLEGVSRLITTIRRIREGLNPDLSLAGVLLTMYDARTNLSAQVAVEVRRHFGDKVFQTVIPRNVRLGEAPSHGLPVILYDPRCRGALAYQQLAQELIRREA